MHVAMKELYEIKDMQLLVDKTEFYIDGLNHPKHFQWSWLLSKDHTHIDLQRMTKSTVSFTLGVGVNTRVVYNEPLGAKGPLLVREEVRNKDVGKVGSW